MIKKILTSFIEAKRFELNMKSLGIPLKKHKTTKVKLTKEQMEILAFCAEKAIRNVNELKNRTFGL